jgi:hypothetical protein
MKQFRTVCMLVVLVGWSQGCATTRPVIAGEEPAAEELSTLAFPDAVPQGCAVAEALSALADPANPAQIRQSLFSSVLAIPPEHICWIAEQADCGVGSCVQLSTIASLIRLHDGPFGMREAARDNADARSAFIGHLARGLDAIAAAEDKPRVAELIDGLEFEQFRDSHANGRPDVDSAVLGDFLDGLAQPLKFWALQNAIPETLERAEKALEDLSSSKESEEELAERAKVRAKALRQREHDRLRAELQRRLLELQAAAERARRAAEIVRTARAQEPLPSPVVKEEAVAEATPEVAEEDAYEMRCREGAASRTLGESPLRATAADIYCLVTEAKANPKVVPTKEVKRLTALFTSLQETVIGLELEELRWTLADPAGAQSLLKELGEIPLVSRSWKKRMANQVKRVCTGHLTTLAKSDHEDIILADQWITECFSEDVGARRKWHRKIAAKLKNAVTWRERLAAERAAKAAAQASSPTGAEAPPEEPATDEVTPGEPAALPTPDTAPEPAPPS